MVRGSFPIGGVTRLPQLCLALLASYLPLFSHCVGEFDMQVGSLSGCHLLLIGGVVQTNNCSKYGAFLVREIKRYTCLMLYVDQAIYTDY